MSNATESTPVNQLRETSTDVGGFDEITGGGLPQGRPALICGGPGSGKTLFGMEFLVRGARDFDEPSVFMSFEEKDTDLVENFSSLGFGLDDLVASNKMALDYVHIERSEILESRGMAHSNQVREFVLSSDGVSLVDVYVGPGGVLTGAARPTRESKDRREENQRAEEGERKKREFASRKLAVEAQVSGLLAELSAQEKELDKIAREEGKRKATAERERAELARQRHAD